MAETNWIEVSLEVSPEQAEAVVEVLNRTIPNGVVVEQDAVQDNSREENLLQSVARVFGYLLADRELELKKKKIEEGIWFLGRIQPLPSPVFTPILDEDWMAAWKKHYHPIKIGHQLVIVPSWIKREIPGRIPIRINPGMAFGTGTHPSTQLCLELMEEVIKPGMQVIDVGCGSGILSVAALKLDADHVLGVDVDPAAMVSTRENSAHNCISTGLEVGIGSVKEILDHQFTLAQAPLVVVNILANTILQLFSDGLVELVTENGYLILAGILESQAEKIIQRAELDSMQLQHKKTSSDWVALLLKKQT